MTDGGHRCRLGGRELECPRDWGDEEALRRLMQEVEPWLATVIRSDHLSLLVGSGLTIAATLAAGADPVTMQPASMEDLPDADKVKAEAARSAESMGRLQPNIEDQIRVAVMLRDGLGVVDDERAKQWNEWLGPTIAGFSAGVLEAERSIRDVVAADAEDQHQAAAQLEAALVSFLLSFAYRAPTRDRLHLFTANYDRLLEYIADLAGLRLLDRFVGSLTPRFRSSRLNVDVHYNPPGIRGEPRYLEGVVRFSKLHGSIDWVARHRNVHRQPVPFGSTPELHAQLIGDATEMLIYPNAAKDVETTLYPYADLFRDFSAAIARPNSVLVTYGYGFGDNHINRIIEDMVALPSTHLAIISDNDPDGRIEAFVDRMGRDDQISWLIGAELAGLEPLVSRFLPHPSLDHLEREKVRLLNERGVNGDQANEDRGDPRTEGAE